MWRIHRRIGMSGGLFVNALLRETGIAITPELTQRAAQPAIPEAFPRDSGDPAAARAPASCSPT